MYSGNLDSSMGFLGRSAAEALPVQAFRSRSVFSRDSWSFLKRVTVVPDDRRFWNMFRPFLGTLPIAAELPGWSTPDSTLHGGCQNRGSNHGTPARAGDADRSRSWFGDCSMCEWRMKLLLLWNSLQRMVFFKVLVGFILQLRTILPYICRKTHFNYYLFILFGMFFFQNYTISI